MAVCIDSRFRQYHLPLLQIMLIKECRSLLYRLAYSHVWCLITFHISKRRATISVSCCINVQSSNLALIAECNGRTVKQHLTDIRIMLYTCSYLPTDSCRLVSQPSVASSNNIKFSVGPFFNYAMYTVLRSSKLSCLSTFSTLSKFDAFPHDSSVTSSMDPPRWQDETSV